MRMRGMLHPGRMAATLALLTALPMAVLAQPAPRPAPPALIVVPALGIGPWTVDRKVADYRWELGVPAVGVNGTDRVFRRALRELSWASPPVFVVYPPTSDTVWAVGTLDPAARTLEQVGVGSSDQQITAAYGPPTVLMTVALRARIMIYDDRGIAFEMPFVPAAAAYGVTARVFVFRPGQARAIWRLP